MVAYGNVTQAALPKSTLSIAATDLATNAIPRSGLVQRNLWNIGPLFLIRLDVGRPDHLGPLLGFRRNEFPEIGRRAYSARCGPVGASSRSWDLASIAGGGPPLATIIATLRSIRSATSALAGRRISRTGIGNFFWSATVPTEPNLSVVCPTACVQFESRQRVWPDASRCCSVPYVSRRTGRRRT
jgi:hypothetical protein